MIVSLQSWSQEPCLLKIWWNFIKRCISVWDIFRFLSVCKIANPSFRATSLSGKTLWWNFLIQKAGNSFSLSLTSQNYCTHRIKTLLQCWRCGFDPWVGRSLGGGNGYPLQYSCLENPMDREAWHAAVHEVTKSKTRLND